MVEFELKTQEAVDALGKVEDGVEDVGKSAKGTKKGLSTMEKGFKAVASAAVIITIIVGAVNLLKKAFTSSEEGQNKYNKAVAVLESIFNNLMDLVADFSESIVEVFENPQQAIEDFANLIKENITNRFEGLLELLPQLGKAIGLLFEGEFAEAGKVAANAVGKVTLGVENIVEKTQAAIEATGEFIKEIEREANVAAAISDKRALADKKERDLIVARAEANRKIAENREKAADKENVSTAERIRLLEEAGAVAEEITRKEIEAARLRFEAIQEENKLSNSNKEAKDAEAEAQARLIELETARLRQQKALTAEITTTRREAESEQNAIDTALHNEELARIKEIDTAKVKADKADKDRREEAAKDKKDKSTKDKKDKEDQAKGEQLIAEGVFNLVSSFAEQDSAEAKAAAIIQAGIDTVKGAQSAFASTPGGIGIKVGAAALAVGIGLANIRKLTAIQPYKKGGSSSSGSAPSAPINTPPPNVDAPDFSINGDDGQSQLANTVQNANTTPTRAYIVSTDISDAESFDRQTENGATF